MLVGEAMKLKEIVAKILPDGIIFGLKFIPKLIDYVKEKWGKKKLGITKSEVSYQVWDKFKDYTFFVGRDLYLSKLHNFILSPTQEEGEKNIFLLFSPGGYGKSAIAHQIKKNLSTRDDNTTWIWLQNKQSSFNVARDSADTALPAYFSYKDFIYDLCLHLRIENMDTFHSRKLEYFETEIKKRFDKDRFIIVLDGLEESANTDLPENIPQLFSNRTKSKLVITSRECFDNFSNSLEVKPFLYSETKEYINKFCEKYDIVKEKLQNYQNDHVKVIYEKTKGIPLRLKWLLNFLIPNDFKEIENLASENLDHYLFGNTLKRVFANQPFAKDVLLVVVDHPESIVYDNILIALKSKLKENDTRNGFDSLLKNYIVDLHFEDGNTIVTVHSDVKKYFLENFLENE